MSAPAREESGGARAGGRAPRVAHVITGLGTGGAEHSLLKVARGLAERAPGERWRSEVFPLLAGGPVAEGLAEIGVPVRPVGMRRGVPSPAALWRLRGLLRRARPDLVVGWMPHGNLAARLAGLLGGFGAPLIWSIRDSNASPSSRLGRGVLRFGARLAPGVDALVFNSRTGRDRYAERGYRAPRVEVIPNGFDAERFRPRPEARRALREELGLPPETPLVGLVARYEPIKDHPTFLAAAARVAADWPAARFVLAGRGADAANAELTARLGALGLEERVFPLGERRDVPEVQAALDVACLSSWAEGFPNVVGEAMASGVPCAVTDVGDAAWLVGETGEVAPARDPRGLAAAVLRLAAEGPEGRERRGRAARRRILADFTLEAMLTRYHQLFEETLRCAGSRDS